jgi:hypothetical protein
MKPRLESAALTSIDDDIRVGHGRCGPIAHRWWLSRRSGEQDRRDAQLMHAWTHVLQADGSFRTCPTCWQIAHSPGAGIVAVNLTGCA